MKFIQARWGHQTRVRPIRVVVIHDMEAPENATTAENVARYFATVDRKASAHVCVDADSEVRCMPDEGTAFHAPPCNADGLGIEHAGYMRQTRAQWLDPYGQAMLKRSAVIVADWCRKYNIPAVHLTVAQLRAGQRGLVGHDDVSAAYGQTDHGDPGKAFPWDYYLTLLRAELGQEDEDEVTPEDIDKVASAVVRKLLLTDLGAKGGGDTIGVQLQTGIARTTLAALEPRLRAIEAKLGGGAQ